MENTLQIPIDIQREYKERLIHFPNAWIAYFASSDKFEVMIWKQDYSPNILIKKII